MVSKFKLSLPETTKASKLLLTRMTLIEPSHIEEPICRDPKDDPILGTAIAGKCQCIITGDKDLLTVKKHKDIDIISPLDFWKYESKVRPQI